MLQRIELESFQDKIEWLWDRVKEQSYAFDDLTKGNSQSFLLALFRPDSRHWYCDSGMASITDIQPQMNANLHFMLWDRMYPTLQLLLDANQVMGEAFDEFSLSRITATIPSFNVPAARLANLLGMKYEGSMREAFLHEGKYHDTFIYGILRREFFAKQEVRSGRAN